MVDQMLFATTAGRMTMSMLRTDASVLRAGTGIDAPPLPRAEVRETRIDEDDQRELTTLADASEFLVARTVHASALRSAARS
ncbi:hypothetical protein OG905_05470 [Streptomyces sp. NBC_00322]|uniref:hypothetical protein n=1 Tax=Streptomyces sp. NBC_00322 TaxID=2975712 RepID=UPI002E2D9724|nr:hypothetical protein [Streptomyces sp. NBC_00322]